MFQTSDAPHSFGLHVTDKPVAQSSTDSSKMIPRLSASFMFKTVTLCYLTKSLSLERRSYLINFQSHFYCRRGRNCYSKARTQFVPITKNLEGEWWVEVELHRKKRSQLKLDAAIHPIIPGQTAVDQWKSGLNWTTQRRVEDSKLHFERSLRTFSNVHFERSLRTFTENFRSCTACIEKSDTPLNFRRRCAGFEA